MSLVLVLAKPGRSQEGPEVHGGQTRARRQWKEKVIGATQWATVGLSEIAAYVPEGARLSPKVCSVEAS